MGMTGNFQAALGQKGGKSSPLRRSEQSKSSSNLMETPIGGAQGISLGSSQIIEETAKFQNEANALGHPNYKNRMTYISRLGISSKRLTCLANPNYQMIRIEQASWSDPPLIRLALNLAEQLHRFRSR